MDLTRALEVARSVAVQAGALLRADFHRAGGPRGSGDKAEADLESERLIRSVLVESFPDWGYLGEETGARPGRPGAPVWLVDPNDGTRDYLRGWRGSTVSIGLVLDRLPVLGVVFAFAYPDDQGDLFAWAEGCGPVRRNGRDVETRLPARLGPLDVVLVSSRGDRAPEQNLLAVAPARFRAMTSIAHRLALVAAGEAAAATSLYAPGAWDYAAGHALVRGVGGVVMSQDGKEVGYGADGSSSSQMAFGAHPTLGRELAARDWSVVVRGDRLPPGPPVHLERGGAIADPGRLARAQGCLLGQLGGDSLGSLVEFHSSGDVADRYADGPRLLEEGGTWGTLAGQPTDDSEMALALARSLVEQTSFSAEDVLAAYRGWHASGPFDVGGTTRQGLTAAPNRDSQANGSLMRVSPLAVFAHGRPEAEAARLARDDASLTHPHPICADAGAAFVVACAHAIREGDGPAAAHAAALGWARRSGAEPRVIETLLAAADSAPVCDAAHQGWVLIALQNAFHELLHAESLEEGVVRTVRRGGDTDTNAAIAGALLGAVHGREAVPRQWRLMVTTCRATPSRARHPRPPAYWPTDAYELAERLLLAGEAS